VKLITYHHPAPLLRIAGAAIPPLTLLLHDVYRDNSTFTRHAGFVKFLNVSNLISLLLPLNKNILKCLLFSL
jgi:hypothetical protein